MFYEHPSFTKVFDRTKLESCLITLTSSESKRLIGKAIPVLPEIKAALHSGTIVINWGTTTAFVVEELLGKAIGSKADFASGVIAEGELNANHPDTKIPPFVLKKGVVSKIHQKEALRNFKPGDIFIKGANALDIAGNVGIMVGAQTGGSIGDAWVAINIRGGCFICPVGLEKLVPSVRQAIRKCDVFKYKYSMGFPVALVTYPVSKVVTEIQALKVLTGADACHIASGGISGSEGAVTLVLEGDADTVERAFELVKSIKGEPPIMKPKKYVTPPAASVGYDSRILSESLQSTL